MIFKKNFRLTNIAMDNPPFFLVNTIKMLDVPASLCYIVGPPKVVYPKPQAPTVAAAFLDQSGGIIPTWLTTGSTSLGPGVFWMQVGTGSVQSGFSFSKRSWCLNQSNPSEKYARQMGSFPQSRVENHKYWMKPSGKLTFAIEKIPPFSIGNVYIFLRSQGPAPFPAIPMLVETGVEQLAHEYWMLGGSSLFFRGELLKFPGCEIRRALY